MIPEDLTALTHRPGPGPHRITIEVDGTPVETLADLPPLRDRLLFVGLNPSPVSVTAGHYHQGRLGQTFWRRLMTAGIIPPATPLEGADDALVAAGHGITDLLKIPTARDDATDANLTAGVGPLWQKIAIWRPAATVFIYKRAANTCAGRQLAEPWGHLPGVALAGRPCILMPGPYAPVESVDEGLNFLRNIASALPNDRA
ncbi:MAG TPA: uracil-DNA glycosylase family protein [Candidatus Limnocylindrales bacterium]